jgi:hypothetical protein
VAGTRSCIGIPGGGEVESVWESPFGAGSPFEGEVELFEGPLDETLKLVFSTMGGWPFSNWVIIKQ